MRCGQIAQIRGCPRNCKRRARAESHWMIREGGKGGDPRARRPAVRKQFQQERLAVLRLELRGKYTDRPAGVPGREQDLKTDDVSPEGAGMRASADLSAVTVVVCATCRDETGSDSHPRAGAQLAASAHAAAAGEIRVTTVDCLGNCKRRLSAALLRDGCWSYVFGDLATTSGSDLIAGAKLFAGSADGLIPWRGRPDSLKRGLVARIPPLASLKDIA